MARAGSSRTRPCATALRRAIDRFAVLGDGQRAVGLDRRQLRERLRDVLPVVRALDRVLLRDIPLQRALLAEWTGRRERRVILGAGVVRADVARRRRMVRLLVGR